VTSAAVTLMERLGLTDDELMAVLEADPLTVITDDLAHRPEVGILLALTADMDAAVLRRWVRARGRGGRPLDLLLARDFAAFEDALGDFAERGLVLRGGGAPPPAGPA
jgi:hypothetical protein